MKHRLPAAILASAILLTGCIDTGVSPISGNSLANENAPTLSDCNNAQYWIDRAEAPDTVLMDRDGIKALNSAITNSDGCVDLDTYPETLTDKQLTDLIRYYELPTDVRYIGSRRTDSAYNNKLLMARNEADVKSENRVSYGFVVKNAQLRTFPTSDVSYEAENDIGFDMFCETVLKTWERVIVLHASADSEWYLVQCYNYLGWISADSVAITDRDTWQKYRDSRIMVVTGNRIFLNENPENSKLSGFELTMGTRLPLVENPPKYIDGVSTASSTVCLLPMRDDNGQFIEQQVRIPLNCDVHEGYLPYTQRNVITQAFKLLGDIYGWGGSFDSRDCSGMILDVYQCFGIDLPRNSSLQAIAGGRSIDISQMSEQEKTDLLKDAPAGALLQMKGHIMLYLGQVNEKPYIIHSYYSCYENGEQKVCNCVAVTDMSLLRANGNTFLEEVIRLNSFS